MVLDLFGSSADSKYGGLLEFWLVKSGQLLDSSYVNGLVTFFSTSASFFLSERQREIQMPYRSLLETVDSRKLYLEILPSLC